MLGAFFLWGRNFKISTSTRELCSRQTFGERRKIIPTPEGKYLALDKQS
jgi:hypothetical protein